MAKIVRSQNRFVNGISDFLKEGQPDSFSFSRAIDTTDPRQPQLQPRAIKESGSVIVDLPKWGETAPTSNLTYVIGSGGTFYRRNADGEWASLRSVSGSHGNGLSYFAEDDYVYYTGDKVIGRYGPVSLSIPTEFYDFTDPDFTPSSAFVSATLDGGAITFDTNGVHLIPKDSTVSNASLTAINSFDLTGNNVSAKVVQVCGGTQVDTNLLVTKDSGANALIMLHENGTLYAIKVVATTQTTVASVAYDATAMLYWRIREASGNSFWEYSANNSDWVVLFSAANPITLTNVYPAISVVEWGASTTDSAIFANLALNDNIDPQFSDDFLGSQGGIRLNTNSLTLNGSTQYGSKTDTASLSITGDISIEAYINPTSLPATGATQTILSKWDESGATRSYRFDIAGVSASFGDGSNGALTISADTTESPIDSACTGSSGSISLAATNASFAANQQVLIHQSQGTGAGLWERNQIASYTTGTITLANPLARNYTTGAQVRVLPQYTNVTINSGKTYTAKSWDGSVGGILAFLCNGTLTVSGVISANGGNSTAYSTAGVRAGAGTGGGFRGGNAFCGNNADGTSNSGEGTGGASSITRTVNGNGAGGGGDPSTGVASYDGGGGGNGTAGANGYTVNNPTYKSNGGAESGNTALTTMTFGGGGAGASARYSNTVSGGGSGGGIIFVYASNIATITGSITANGGSAASAGIRGGGGAGGSILIKTITANLGTGLVTANGGSGGTNGGAGAVGRIHCDYFTSVAGTTSPSLNSTQDNSLSTNTTYQLRLSISTDGTALETLARNCDLVLSTWKHVAVTWDASEKTARFYLNGNLLGTAVGALSAISDNASALYLGAHKGASAVGNFLNAKIDEVRLWNDIRTASEILGYRDTQISATSLNLVAYYKLNADSNDATVNANNLTLTGSPVYTTDTPFLSPTTRQDIDLSQTLSGQTYTVPTAITEAAGNAVTFTPTKDPQKSISVLVDTVGTGNWTLTVHDASNVVVTSATILNASVLAGQLEFIFPKVWRPLENATYHFHLTTTTGDGKVTTGTTADLSTVDYKTYYQFLVEDTQWHPIAKMLQFLVFGNERYIGKYEATLYNPNYIKLPAGWRIRCFGYWREYLAIGCMKGDNIYTFDNGRVYFWDGISTTYNFYIDVPEGGVNALLGSRGKLFVWAGYQGDILTYQGGETADKIKRIPNSTPDKFIEIYPGAVTMWKSIINFGAGNSDSTVFQRGVYSYGAINTRYNDSMSFDFVNSGGTYGNSVEIGLCMVVNKKLLIGYRDGISYAVDYVDGGNPPAPSGTIEGIVQDEGFTWKTKEAMTAVATFLPLRAGESVAIKYKLDRASDWTSSAPMTTVGTTQVRLLVSPTTSARCKEYQLAVDMATTGTTSPQLINMGMEVDTLESEQIFGE